MEKQKKFSLKNYLYEYKWWYVFGIAILLCVDLANIYIPQFIGDIIDGLTNETLTKAGIPMMLMKILIAGLIMMFGRFGWRYCIFGASRKIEYRLRNDMFGHLETLSARYFNEHKTGDLMAHFTNDLEAVRVAVGMAVITTFDAAVMSIMVIIKMIIYVDLRLTVLAFVPMILVAIGCYFFGVQMKKRQTARQEAFSFLSDKVQESISGIRVLKAFVQEKKDLEEFQKANENNMEKNLAVVKLRSLFGPLLDLITGISLLLTLIIGGKMVINGTVSVGQFVAFNSYIGMLVWPMIACGDCINTFSQASAGYKRIKDIFDEKPDIIDKVVEKDGEHLTGDIELKNLTFQYPDGDTPVLKNVSVHIKPGEMLAVLGRTGSGKSTLADLLLRVYDCEKGMLLMDGRPIDEIPLHVLHRDVAYVPQENFMFSDTLEENIAFGLKLKKLPKEEIRKKVKRVLDIVDLEGFENRKISTLSGGQQQRIAIARALVNEPEILMLDEPLGALDLKMRQEMQIELKHMHDELGITFIYVTHDQEEALTMSDKIVVLSEGRIQQIGTPEDIYNEPQNAFVADFIGESNIFKGIMTGHMKVRFCGGEFIGMDDVPEGTLVDVVVRPEDVIITKPEDGIIEGEVVSVIFKGMHYEVTVESGKYEMVIRTTKCYSVGERIGMKLEPDGIHIMLAEDHTTSFVTNINSDYTLDFNGKVINCDLTKVIPKSSMKNNVLVDENNEAIDTAKLKVMVSIQPYDIRMSDNVEEGLVSGHIINLIYKGDHYSYVIRTEYGHDLIVDDEYLWNMDDAVGLVMLEDKMKFQLKK